MLRTILWNGLILIVIFISVHWLYKTTGRCPSAVAPFGKRGIINFKVSVACARQDLHSCSFGGTIPEAMTDLTWLLSQLTNSKGRIFVPDAYNEGLLLPTPEALESLREGQTYHDELIAANQIRAALVKSRDEWLLAAFYNPSISIHDIKKAFDGPGEKTVISGSVIGKFSMRCETGQNADNLGVKIDRYLREKFKERVSPNKLITRYECKDLTS